MHPCGEEEAIINWEQVKGIAKYNKVTAITDSKNRIAITKYIKSTQLPQSENLSFEYYNLPSWLKLFIGSDKSILRNYFWQIGVVFFILRKKIQFDLAHQLNCSKYSLPSFLWILKKPFFWGEVRIESSTPIEYLTRNSGHFKYHTYRLKESAKKFLWTMDPFISITKRTASRILTTHSKVHQLMNLSKGKELRISASATNYPRFFNTTFFKSRFTVLSIGRFVPKKGFDIVIESFGHFYHQQTQADQEKLRLILIGKGPEKENLQKLVKDLELDKAVRFIDWMSREGLANYFRFSSALINPAIGGRGRIVPEALSFGVPVLCYDNETPGEYIKTGAGMKVKYSNPRESIVQFSKYLNFLLHEPEVLDELSREAKELFKQAYSWQKRGELISQAYLDTLFPNQGKVLKKKRMRLEEPILC